MNAIETRALTKCYKDCRAVDCLDFFVREGELFSLLGINGAGKTTTLKMLACLTPPSEGDAFVIGHSVSTEQAEIKRLLGVSPQETAIAPGLTVLENLELICGIYGFSKEKTRQMIEKAVKEFDLQPILSKRAGKLSGGWQRKVSIAMALISEPKILFLDEPTLGLDVIARSELWDKIRALKGKVTVILTTHYMEEAEALSDRIGIMKNGRMLMCDTLSAIREKTGCERLEDAFIRVVKEG